MPVTAQKNGITRTFTCREWDALESGSGWTEIENTCTGEGPVNDNPFANNGDVQSGTNSSGTVQGSTPPGTFSFNVVGSYQFQVGQYNVLEYFLLQSSSPVTVKVGTTSGGSEIWEETLGTNDSKFTRVDYPFLTPLMVYITGTCIIRLKLEKLPL